MKNTWIACKIFIALTIITGIIYPLTITGMSQLLFPDKANGSMIVNNNKIVGSVLIGQQFSKPEFFWGRPSAIANNPMPSGGSNMSPVGTAFKAVFLARVDTIRKYHGNIALSAIPKDLLFASGSGVDPEISPEAAYFQIDRIADCRNLNKNERNSLTRFVESSIIKPDLIIFGETRINVLKLNIYLQSLERKGGLQ